MTSNQILGKTQMPLKEARKRCVEAAVAIVREHGGSWQWIDDKRLRIYALDDTPVMTLHLEQIQ